jgi:hypothetical protein
MKILVIGLLSLFLSPLAMASGPDWMLGSSLNNAVSYVQTGADVITVAAGASTVLTRTTNTPKTFYLDLIDMEAAFNVISGTAVAIGTCSLQVPAGNTIMSWNFQNSTTSSIDRHFVQLSHAIAVPASFAISCNPKASTSSYWNVNYFGYEN